MKLIIQFNIIILLIAYSSDAQSISDSSRVNVLLNFPYDELILINKSDISDSLHVKKGKIASLSSVHTEYYITASNHDYSVENFDQSKNRKDYIYPKHLQLSPSSKKPSKRNLLNTTRYWGANRLIHTDEDTDVYKNGVHIGRGTHLLYLAYGDTLSLSNENYKGKVIRRAVPIDNALFSEIHEPFRVAKSSIWYSGLIPGLLQIKMKKKKIGSLFLGITLIQYSMLAYQTHEYMKYHFRYNNAYDEYLKTESTADALDLRFSLIQLNSNRNHRLKQIQRTSVTLLATYIFSNMYILLSDYSLFEKISFEPRIDSREKALELGIKLKIY